MLTFDADPRAVDLAHRFGRRLFESDVWARLEFGRVDHARNEWLMKAANHEALTRLSHERPTSIRLLKASPIFTFFSQLVGIAILALSIEWIHSYSITR